MTLHISPEHLPVTSAELVAAETTLVGSMTTAAATAAPVPAAIDPVSILSAAAFAGYAAPFFELTATGAGHLQAGAQELVPVSVNYQGTDTTGGAVVTPRGAAFNG
ncbi:PE domain-containing protein [Nocardia otitidiscaviarum]|uniref:PE domain-containing protein n=1 Tax=Nocardia otitidiscaviarum TaxID=1823 RepID=UPI0004A7003B|nr:PE domain-containing protein [Nocardia otitidiscaviarum]MBF6132043.1 PE domain-containing protein [Nocardia otitidiscaviarum]MBF6241573.1 PE domain-containing protein [Nocardia otitidiscaviarum]MBF6483173.1 PE domain-containing protein [Nocardia otitidiscaviarum]